MGDFFDPVFLGKFFVSLLCFVYLNACQLGVLSLLLELRYLFVSVFFRSLDLQLVFTVVDAFAGPFTPALFDLSFLYFLP